jgi:hypothetical protein
MMEVLIIDLKYSLLQALICPVGAAFHPVKKTRSGVQCLHGHFLGDQRGDRLQAGDGG